VLVRTFKRRKISEEEMETHSRRRTIKQEKGEKKK
jgi:hypothetical protein